jgi:hypothetical protein
MVMAEVVITLVLFAVVMVMAALLFGGWVIVSIIRLVFRALGAVFSPTPMPRRVSVASSPVITCPNARCRSANPIAARFCRRCGVAIPAPQHVAVRRAAMW